jgi:hypothetical protein
MNNRWHLIAKFNVAFQIKIKFACDDKNIIAIIHKK